MLVFFTPKFLFPALIAASVFPSLVAYSGSVFSTLALWIVGIVLVAGAVVTLAHGPLLGSAYLYPSIPSLVQDQLGRFPAALAASSSLLGMVMAVGTLVSAGVTFLVVALSLDPQWRFLLVIAAFVVLGWNMLHPLWMRRAIAWISVLVFLVLVAVVTYGFAQYFRAGAHPSLLELLSGATDASELVQKSNQKNALKAMAVAALLLVPVSPVVRMFRNEKSNVAVSALEFRILGIKAGADFALSVYLSFVVAGFHWNRLDTVVQGPGNWVKLLEIMLDHQSWVTIPVIALLAVGFLVASYIYLSSASVLLVELGRHDLLPHQVPNNWRYRGRSVLGLMFLALTFAVALCAPNQMERAGLLWVFYTVLAGFLGQLARLRLWHQRYLCGSTKRDRQKAQRHHLIALLSLGISTVVLLLVSLAFEYPWGLVALGLWLALALCIGLVQRHYRQLRIKARPLMVFDDSLTHTRAVALVWDFDKLSLNTVRYAWAAHHPQLEVLVVRDSARSESQLRQDWAELQIPAALTVIEAQGADYLTPVRNFIEALLEEDQSQTVSLYAQWRVGSSRLSEFFHNATPRALMRMLSGFDCVTVTLVRTKL